ncbi:mitogen-activated protein kinase kinase kinase YODA-like isoform X2 [Actinia tenebrosa]|uniref:Mitogen-activated protein kinase kinase kinase YODA-like isoform X2 n=1 Tax=Actinia tenebrosa TaxID=6105 RepID=A0A6P8I190_ACTTE|nr:mitogen-activated protein kinase kinase kinase YODA-like isoform X2 [Actinia tenebrosa]
MDESDVDIFQDANNTNALREESEEFTDDLESGNGTDVRQKEDGANYFESLTRPISAASAVSNALEDRFLKSNSGEEKTDDDTYNQNNVETSGNEIHATVPNDSLEHEASIENVSEVDPSAEVPAGPKSSSPAFGNDPSDIAEEIRNHLIPKYKPDGRGFCWPVDKLPLSGELRFEEGEQWKVSEKIGHGASGQCFLGHPVGKENLFCVKKCKYHDEELKALCLAAKAKYVKKISEGAKKIVLLYGATYYKSKFCIFMEYMEGGTVHDAIIENREYQDGLDKIDCANYFKDVLLALEFIHRENNTSKPSQLTYDLVQAEPRTTAMKVNNVLLTAFRLEAKLCDFGKAAGINQHNPASKDVWSGGCFLLEMLGEKYFEAFLSGLAKKDDVLDRLPEDVEQDTYEVLSKCFCSERNKYTASEVLKSAFLNNVN